jgi:hypothetical protein
VLQSGLDSDPALAFLMIGGVGELDYYGADNLAMDQTGKPLPLLGRYGDGDLHKITASNAPLAGLDGYDLLPSSAVENYLSTRVGARPWDRGSEERRVLASIAARSGHLIDDEKQVGGYPSIAATRKAFKSSDWNLATMAPKKNRRYPGEKR